MVPITGKSVTDAPSIVRTVRLPGVQALTPITSGSRFVGFRRKRQLTVRVEGAGHCHRRFGPSRGSDCPAVSADGLRVITGAGFPGSPPHRSCGPIYDALDEVGIIGSHPPNGSADCPGELLLELESLAERDRTDAAASCG